MHACRNHEQCTQTALHRAERLCRDRGLRFTRLRRKVLERVWATHAPVKAYDILDQLRAEGAPAQPPTVYRALNFLLENGLAHKLNSCNAYVGCSHPLKHDECYFLICKGCGEAKECCSGALTRAISGAADRNRFQTRHTTLEIEGECRTCAEKNRDRSG